MATIPGASQYLNSATLANTQGRAAQTPTLLGTDATTSSLLEVGRSILDNNGIGISKAARALFSLEA